MVLTAVLAGVGAAHAQVEKTVRWISRTGDTTRVPTLTRSDLHDIRLNGPRGAVRLGKITTVASIDEAIDLLGDPDSTQIKHIDAGSYERSIRPVYDGMEVRYMDYVDDVAEVRLINLDLGAKKYWMVIGEVKIQPRMPLGGFSESLRKAQDEDGSTPTRSHLIRISEKRKTSKGKTTSEIAEHEAISIKVDESADEITQVRYYTTI